MNSVFTISNTNLVIFKSINYIIVNILQQHTTNKRLHLVNKVFINRSISSNSISSNNILFSIKLSRYFIHFSNQFLRKIQKQNPIMAILKKFSISYIYIITTRKHNSFSFQLIIHQYRHQQIIFRVFTRYHFSTFTKIAIFTIANQFLLSFHSMRKRNHQRKSFSSFFH